MILMLSLQRNLFLMSTILVTGAGGQLGSEMRLLSKGLGNFIFTDVAASEGVEPLDICSAGDVENFFTRHNVDFVVNCAAYTNVNGAESNEALCRRINVDGPVNLARSAKKHGAALIQISTDYVFDGNRKRGSYREDNACHPQSVYGVTKRECELKLRRIGCKGVIIRTAWLYSTFGNNFVKTMLRLGTDRKEIGVVADQFGTPTYARDLAKAIMKILPQIGDRRCEIFHYTNEGVCTWFDFSAMIMSYAGLDCKVNPLTTDEYPTPAARPAYSVLSKEKIRETFGVETPWWNVSLKSCLKELGY